MNRLTPAEMVDRLRQHLAFVLDNAQQQEAGSWPNAGHLLHLSESETRQIAAIHLLNHELTAAVVEGLPAALRSLPRTTEFEQLESRTGVRGRINWPATVAAQANAGLDRTIYVTTPPFRAFDVLETQLIKQCVMDIARLVDLTQPVRRKGEAAWNWERALDAAATAVAAAQRNWVLMSASDLPPPSEPWLSRAASTRNRFVREAVVPWLRQYGRVWMGARLDRGLLQDLLARTAFVSTEPGRLFELLVLFELFRGFSGLSTQYAVGLLAPSRTDVFGTFQLRSGATIELRYQRRPTGLAQADEVAPALKYYMLPADAGRPDVIVDCTRRQRRRMIIEIKDSEHDGYLADGMYQLASYIRAFRDPSIETMGTLVSWRRSFDREPPAPQEPDALGGLRAATLEGLFPLVQTWLDPPQ